MTTDSITVLAHIIDVRGVYLRSLGISVYDAQPAGAIYDSEGDTLPDAIADFTRMRRDGSWVQVANANVPLLPDASESVQVVPTEVPRWAGVLALKRHATVNSELVVLAPDDDGSNSLHAAVLAFRETMQAGESRDRLDVALNDAKDWLRTSPTVQSMCSVLSLTGNQADALFAWADAQLGTV